MLKNNNYSWKTYNNKIRSFAQFLEKYNNISKVNFIEKSFYNHTRDIFCLGILNSKKTNILDYGSNETVISNIKNKIDISNKTFYIYSPYNDYAKKNNPIRGIKKIIINDLKKVRDIKFDVIHFGSCLQYIDKYEKFIDKINYNKKCKIIITATPLSLKNTYISKQNNQKNLYQTVHSLKKLKSYFKKKKFDLTFQSAFNLRFAGLSLIKKDTFFINLIFNK